MAVLSRRTRPLTSGEFRVRAVVGTFGAFLLLAALIAMIIG